MHAWLNWMILTHLRGLSEYVNGFRGKLFVAWKMGSENLTEAQEKIFDHKAEVRVFSPADHLGLSSWVYILWCGKSLT